MLAWVKKEAVLCLASLAAIISCFFNPPSAAYIDFLDLRVLILLFSLMLAVAGAREAGAFSFLCRKLLSGVRDTRRLVLLLSLGCFFLSMLITNDVALITLVPLALLTLSAQPGLLIPAVILMTVGANLGSALTPMGNPQNLFLFSAFSLSMPEFFGATIPLTLLSLVLLVAASFLFPKRPNQPAGETVLPDMKRLLPWVLLFLIALLTVLRLLNAWALLGVALIFGLLFNRRLLLQVDYSLLLTFIAFFIFVGNIKAIPAVSDLLGGVVSGNECLCGVLLSQVISNVPAAVLLSGFSSDPLSLLVGVNLGGLGTPIASMASLISYKLYAASPDSRKGRYMGLFLLLNFGALALLWGLCILLYPNL